MTFVWSSTIASRHLASIGLLSVMGLSTSPVWAQTEPVQQQRQQDEGDRFDGRRRGFDGPGMGRGGFGGPMDRGGMAQLMEPEFLRRDVPIFVQTLELDQSQRPILETLIIDYTTSFEEAMQAMRDRFGELRARTPEQEAQAEQRREVGQAMRDAIGELRALRAATPEGEQMDEARLEEIRTRLDGLQQQMRDLRPPRPEGEELARLRESMTAIGNDWRNARKTLRDGFMEDVQIILTAEQVDKLPALERQLRREKTLRRSQLSGEGVDLVLVVRDMKLSPDEAAIAEAPLAQYELALDAALIARNERLESIRGEVMGAMMDRDTDRALSLAAEESRLRVAVRTVNEQAVEVLAAVLGPERGSEVRAAFTQRAYPRIARATYVQQSFDAALEFEDLSPETLAAVSALDEQYESALATSNAQLIAQLRETEPQRITRRIEFWAARVNDQEPPAFQDEFRQQLERRIELDRTSRQQLESLLTAEQIALLPQAPSEQDWGDRDRGRGPRGEGRFDAEGNAELMRRFDTNGDGTLDEAERQQMREMFRQRREVQPPI